MWGAACSHTSASSWQFYFGLKSRTLFLRACERASLKGVTPHTLRHSFASRLVMAGVDLRTIQELDGWQTIGMVDRYSYLSPSHKAQAVERIASSLTPVAQAHTEPVLVAAR